MTITKTIKEKRNILAGCRVTKSEYQEIYKSAANNSRTIAGEIRSRIFRKEKKDIDELIGCRQSKHGLDPV